MEQQPFDLAAANSTADIILHPTDTSEPDGFWLPVDLPTMGLAGYAAQIKVRKFSVPDLVRLGAARKNSSYPQIVTAIGATLKGVDVNLLTHGDFDFLMHWHSINSITKTPLIVKWNSRYGNENKTEVTSTTRQIISIENADKVVAMKERGFDFSRVGDEIWRLHMVDLDKFTPELEIEYALATWVKVDNPLNFEDKLAKVRAMQDLSFYEDLDEWRIIANHGVKTVAMLTCQHFAPETAIESVSRALALLDASAGISEMDEYLTKQTMSLLDELAVLKKLEASNRLSEAVPVAEEVEIPLDVTNFFPVAL